jgi:transposase-like protein
MQKAADQERAARAERDREVRAMLKTPGTSLGSVARDLGISKSLVRVIQREGTATDPS